MKSTRIDKAVGIIEYAIKNQISVTEASVKCGCAYTYVKNVKAIVYDLYDNNAISDELFDKFNDAYKRYEQGDLKLANENKRPTEIPNVSGEERTNYKENGNEAIAEWISGSNYPDNHIKTLNDLLEILNVDQNIWKVKEHWLNKWDTTSMKYEEPITIQNFQVKARLEKNVSNIKERKIGELFQDMVKNYKPPVLNMSNMETPLSSLTKEKNLLEISLFDLHLGKLCWRQETGEDFDIKIARTRFLNTIETLLMRAKAFNYDRILFPVGNDFLNSDTIYNTTTKGTLVDEDVRWQKTFGVATKLLVDSISLLKQSGVPVDVIIICGNHDYERSFYLGAFLEAWYRDDTMISINNGASSRKYYRYGKVLLGLTHGSEEKESSLPLLMATDIESKPMWSETLYHEFHVGHVHRKRDVKFTVLDKGRITQEDLGVTVRYLSSLTGTDSWHFKKGFVGAIKAGDAFIWNDKAGMIAHLNANLVV